MENNRIYRLLPMKEPIFESVIADKYNIHEEFSVVGTFVAFPNFNNEPSCLVNIGFSDRFLVVARLILSGEIIDYELLSLSPIHLLSLSVQNHARKTLVVESPFKMESCVYQLCTSDDQEEIWKQFMFVIQNSYEQNYCSKFYETSGSDNGEPEAAVIIPSDSVTVTAPSVGNGIEQTVSIIGQINGSKRPVALEELHVSSSTKSPEVPGKYNIDFLYDHVVFDKFVNDNPIEEQLNISNNATNSRNSFSVNTGTRMQKFTRSLKQIFQWKKRG